MLDEGLASPLHLTGVTVRVAAVTSGAYSALTLPDDLGGNDAHLVLLSWRIDNAASPVHLRAKLKSVAAAPASDDGVPILHGLAHNPIILNATGQKYLYMKSMGADLYVTVGSIGNEMAANFGPLNSPLRISGDTVGFTVSNASTYSFTAWPHNAAGEDAKYVLLAWDDRTQYLRLSHAGLAYGHYYLGKDMNPCILNVAGWTRCSFRMPTSPTTVRVTPLENF